MEKHKVLNLKQLFNRDHKKQQLVLISDVFYNETTGEIETYPSEYSAEDYNYVIEIGGRLFLAIEEINNTYEARICIGRYE